MTKQKRNVDNNFQHKPGQNPEINNLARQQVLQISLGIHKSCCQPKKVQRESQRNFNFQQFHQKHFQKICQQISAQKQIKKNYCQKNSENSKTHEINFAKFYFQIENCDFIFI